jgi:hypothetical protein
MARARGLGLGEPLTGGGGHGDNGASCALLLGGDIKVQPHPLHPHCPR